MTDLQYNVPGMTCGHCVSSITKEVETVSGVTAVNVDLDTKIVTVSGESLDDANVREAISEAGYEAEAVASEQSTPKAEGSCCGGGGCSTN
jgi:copper chaperone